MSFNEPIQNFALLFFQFNIVLDFLDNTFHVDFVDQILCPHEFLGLKNII